MGRPLSANAAWAIRPKHCPGLPFGYRLPAGGRGAQQLPLAGGRRPHLRPRHYLDHASTAPLRPEARDAMDAWAHSGVTGDPGRVHTEGRITRAALEDGRERSE